MSSAAKTVLVLLFNGFEEIEALAPVDLLRRAGIEVTTAGLLAMHVTGRSGITVHADTTLEEAPQQAYDLVIVPGGPGVKELRADPRIVPLLRRHAEAGKQVAAICAAPTVLADADLLQDRRYTAHFSVAGELPAICASEAVVRDGAITTSRGAGTALEFGLELIRQLVSEEAARQVADSICYRPGEGWHPSA
jgi:protein deglycase